MQVLNFDNEHNKADVIEGLQNEFTKMCHIK